MIILNSILVDAAATSTAFLSGDLPGTQASGIRLLDSSDGPNPGTTLLAQTVTWDVIRTQDGAVHTGNILRETREGYLFRSAAGSTYVIPFTAILDIQSTGEGAAAFRVPQRVDHSQRITDLTREIDTLEAQKASLIPPAMTMTLGVVMGVMAYLYAPIYIILAGGTFISGGVYLLLNNSHNDKLDRQIASLEEERRRLKQAAAAEVQAARPPTLVVMRF